MNERGITTMSLNDWFNKGITKEAYMERLDKHKEAFHHIYESFSIPSPDVSQLEGVKNIRALVLAAEWCGHCMLDIAIYLRIADQANIPTRFLIRDDNLELMDQYLTNEKRYIPIFIFIDEDGNEIGKWGPWAPEINELTEKLKENLPERDSEKYEAAFQNYIKQVGTAFEQDKTLWNYVYNDIKQTVLTI